MILDERNLPRIGLPVAQLDRAGPTLVMLDGGKEVGRLVRPTEAGEIGKALEKIDPAP